MSTNSSAYHHQHSSSTKKYSYASSISSTEKSYSSSRQRGRHKSSNKPTSSSSTLSEITVFLDQRAFTVTGLTFTANCHDLIFAVLWFRNLDDHKHTNLQLLKLSSNYEMVIECGSRLKRIRGHLSVHRVVRHFSKVAQDMGRKDNFFIIVREKSSKNESIKIEEIDCDSKEKEDLVRRNQLEELLLYQDVEQKKITNRLEELNEEFVIRQWINRLNLDLDHKPNQSLSYLDNLVAINDQLEAKYVELLSTISEIDVDTVSTIDSSSTVLSPPQSSDESSDTGRGSSVIHDLELGATATLITDDDGLFYATLV